MYHGHVCRLAADDARIVLKRKLEDRVERERKRDERRSEDEAKKATKLAQLEREKPIIEACADVQLVCPATEGKAPTVTQMRKMAKEKGLHTKSGIPRTQLGTALLPQANQINFYMKNGTFT